MTESGKKFSFAFSKVSKSSGPFKPVKTKEKEDVQYIDCLDSKAIVCKNVEHKEEKVTDLIIPLNKYSLSKPEEKQKEDVQRKKISTDDKSTDAVGGDSISSNSLEETAVREILDGVKNSAEVAKNSNTSTLEIWKSRYGTGDSSESTFKDYESIPVADYGMAMLRGMGWKPGKGIGKTGRTVTADVPLPRPRGMGLGADKVASLSTPSAVSKEKGEELKVIKGAFVRVISGSQRGQYGQIEGFNEDSGRVIVRLSFRSSSVTVNENAFELVTEEEYSKNSRVLNLSKYEEYRQNSDVSKEVGSHNTHHGEKRQHKSQQTTDHSRKRLK